MLNNKIIAGSLAIVAGLSLAACSQDVSTEAQVQEVAHTGVSNVSTSDNIKEISADSIDLVSQEFNNVLSSSSALSSLFGSSLTTEAPGGSNAGNGNIVPNNADNDVFVVDACDLNGYRFSNVAVDIGYGEREYWGYTNDHGQLVEVFAPEITLQTKDEEKSNGRYCWDEAKVPGVESSTLDEGHVIGDALGGVSNAYNITPQDSTLNRSGGYYQFEREIQRAGGAKNFYAQIRYSNTTTQTPSQYILSYELPNGELRNHTFSNQ